MKTKKCYETHKNCNGNTCNMDTQHTPTPWEIVDLSSTDTMRNYQLVGNGKGAMLLRHSGEMEHLSEGKANVDLILSAVNAHEDLIFQNDLLKKSLEMSDKKIETTLGQYKALEEKYGKLLSSLRFALSYIKEVEGNSFVAEKIENTIRQA